jgi:hypothetical protein
MSIDCCICLCLSQSHSLSLSHPISRDFYIYLSPPHLEIEDRHCDVLLETDKAYPVVLRVIIGTNLGVEIVLRGDCIQGSTSPGSYSS